jgi:N-methylhydantoinase B/oxoprolinase/acetone carboxylase alpha subunit
VPNSGGYGDPLERDPELVRSDVLDGFTTAKLAERDYGVVVSPDGGAVDVEGTARLRERLRGAGASLTA